MHYIRAKYDGCFYVCKYRGEIFYFHNLSSVALLNVPVPTLVVDNFEPAPPDNKQNIVANINGEYHLITRLNYHGQTLRSFYAGDKKYTFQTSNELLLLVTLFVATMVIIPVYTFHKLMTW